MSKFSDQLSQAIKLSGKSKNQIIEESKINRSSFFQFLNGKRMPTKEHLTAGDPGGAAADSRRGGTAAEAV